MTPEEKGELEEAIKLEIQSQVYVTNSDMFGPSLDGVADAASDVIELLERRGVI